MMIKGIGIDIVDVKRFEGVVGRHGKRFIGRVFTEGESLYCNKKHRPGIHFAARFAAKEAVIKAIGRAIPFRDIEITREETGRPLLNVKGYKNDYTWHLSIAHNGNYSLAYVIMEVNIEAG
jgi:holo-[acyl-carrier protein] synthase